MRYLLLSAIAISLTGFVPIGDIKPKPENSNVVIIETTMGDIKVELDPEKAPITVKNFLSYVDEKFYDDTLFHRVINDFMIQGGGHDREFNAKKAKDPIKNESKNGLSNSAYTIAMARMQDPDSATSQFFINVVDNARLDEAGYAVFGKVIAGKDIVDSIKKVETGSRKTQSGAFNDVPTTDIVIKSIRREKKK